MKSDAGYTLLETLLAFAIATLVVGTLYKSSFTSIQQSQRVWAQYQSSEIASAIFTQAYVTKDYPSNGSFGTRWKWELVVTEFTFAKKSEYDGLIRHDQLTLTIWPKFNKLKADTYQMIIARRR